MKKYIIYYLALSFCFLQSVGVGAQNIGINATGAAPDSSAMLDISSTDKGLLIPRMDSTSRKNILQPAQGLLVFDNDYNNFWYYDGGAWQTITKGLDQQDLSRSGDSLYLTNNPTGIDLSAFKQDFIFTNDTLGLTGSSNTVDLRSIADNLGNHTATENLQLDGHYLSHDGDDEGILIDTSGQVGINSSLPQAPFHVGFGPSSTLDTSIFSAGTNSEAAGTVWQSFSTPENSYLATFTCYNFVDVPPTQTSYNFHVYEGEGTGGTLLYSGTSTLVGNTKNDCICPNIPLLKDSTYSIEIIRDPSNTETFAENEVGTYAQGRSSTSPLHDLTFNLAIRDNPKGYQLSDTAFIINEYRLPITDGTANDVLVLDASGKANWSNLISSGLADNFGNHTATKDLQLNNNWLSHNGQLDAGLYVNATGQVGFETVPVANLHVSMPANLVEFAAFTSPADTYENVVLAWQSFTCTQDGKLSDLLLTFASYPIPYWVTVSLLEGEGTSGPTLYSTSAAINVPSGPGDVSFAPSASQNIYLVAGQKYSIQISNAVRWQQVDGNPYAGGISSFDSNQDFGFKVYGSSNLGFRVNDTGVSFNQYTLPATDGMADQVLITDSAGTMSWTTLNIAPNQQLSLSGDTLYLANGGNPISLDPYLNADDMGNHIFSQDFSLGNHWVQNNNATAEGLQLNSANALFVQSPASKLATFHHVTGGNGSFIEVNNRAGTRALFGPEGNFFTGGSIVDVAMGNWGSHGDFLLFTSNLERMRVDSVGKVGIGRIPTTNPFEVNGDASKSTAGGWLANSDARLKKNIEALDATEMLDKLLSLQGVSYEWNDEQTGHDRPEGIQYGFTAQNIQEVFPELVSEDHQGYLQTAYGTYDAMTVESLRALNEEIEALTAENKMLERKQKQEWTTLKAKFDQYQIEQSAQEAPSVPGEEQKTAITANSFPTKK